MAITIKKGKKSSSFSMSMGLRNMELTPKMKNMTLNQIVEKAIKDSKTENCEITLYGIDFQCKTYHI